MWNNTWSSQQLFHIIPDYKARSNNSWWKILHARHKLLLHLILRHLDYERIRRLCWTWHSMKLEFCSFWHQPICYGALKKNPCFISRYPDWPYLRLCMCITPDITFRPTIGALNGKPAVCIREFFSLYTPSTQLIALTQMNTTYNLITEDLYWLWGPGTYLVTLAHR